MTNSNVLIDAESNIFIAGSFYQAAWFSESKIDGGQNGDDAVLASLSSDGSFAWGYPFGSSAGFDKGYDHAWSAAMHGKDALYFVGEFGYKIDFGEGEFFSPVGGAFVARFDAFGEHQDSAAFLSSSGSALLDVETDLNGLPVVAGGWTINNVCGEPNTQCMRIWVSKLKSDLEPLWTRKFGSELGGAYAQSLAVSPSGKVAFTAYYRSFELVLDNFTLTKQEDKDHLIVVLLDSDGNVIWVHDAGVATGNNNRSTATRFDSTGALLVYRTNHDMGVHLDKWSPAGELIWSKKVLLSGTLAGYPAKVVRSPISVAIDAANSIYIVGRTGDVADVGGGILQGEDGTSFVAKYDSDGNHLWSLVLKEMGIPFSVAVANDGAVVVDGKTAIVKYQQ
jgi:hypothetical protein